MRVRVQRIGQGDHPHGVVVELITATGPLRLVVDDTEVERDSVAVGYPLRRDNELVFVALPRQTQSGSFRVLSAVLMAMLMITYHTNPNPSR